MDEEGLTIFDVEHAILTGEILERQKDRQTADSKYRLRGESMGDDQIEVKDLFLIENVPVVSCPNCGESYLTATTLLDRGCDRLLRLDITDLSAEEASARIAAWASEGPGIEA